MRFRICKRYSTKICGFKMEANVPLYILFKIPLTSFFPKNTSLIYSRLGISSNPRFVITLYTRKHLIAVNQDCRLEPRTHLEIKPDGMGMQTACH